MTQHQMKHLAETIASNRFAIVELQEQENRNGFEALELDRRRETDRRLRSEQQRLGATLTPDEIEALTTQGYLPRV